MISVPDAPLSLYSVIFFFFAGNAIIKYLIDAWNIPKLSILKFYSNFVKTYLIYNLSEYKSIMFKICHE